MVLNEESKLDEDWSNDWKDYTDKEQFQGAAPTLRKEIMSLRILFSSQPTPEKEIDSETIQYPKHLNIFQRYKLLRIKKFRRERLLK